METECSKSGSSAETVGKMEKSMRTAQCSDAADSRNAVSCVHRWISQVNQWQLNLNHLGPRANFLRNIPHSALY